MKHIIQYINYALVVIHAICAVPAVLSFAFTISMMWLMMHEKDRGAARQMWAQIVAYAKKVYE